MREIQSSEAKAHLSELLTDVERGESIVITRHGRAIARLVPELDRGQAAADQAISALKLLGRSTGKIALDEILSARDDGRKYR